MKREFLKAFEGLTDEIIDKIMDENGRDIQRAKGDYDKVKADLSNANQTIQTMTDEMQTLKDNNADAADWKKKFEDLQAENTAKAEQAKAEQEDKELTEAITAVYGDKKFTSDYVKNGIIADMKAEIAKPENKGKGYSELFESLTKDKEGIFASVNPSGQMSGITGGGREEISDEQVRAVMGLK